MLIRLCAILVRLLPAPAALLVIRALATRSQRPPISPPQQEALDQATALRYGPGGRNTAWAWGQGPLVVLVHGWNGRAAQLAPLAAAIAASGFRCVAIEVTGHGSSPGARTGWACFIDDIAALSRSLDEPVHAYVGHSAGALTMMAARRLRGTHAARYVCICAPSHPYPPVNVIRQRLNPPPGVIGLYQAHLARQFGPAWERLASGFAYEGAGSDLLLFFDEADRFVDHSEGDRIAAWCPGARLAKTAGYSHARILAAPELAQAVGDFLREPARPVFSSPAPFNNHARVEMLGQPGRTRIADVAELKNHFGTVHGGALFTVGEVAAARAVLGELGDQAAQLTAVTRRAEIRYLKAARGAIVAQATPGVSIAEALRGVGRDGRASIPVEVSLMDDKGLVVAEMSVDWHVARPRATA